MPDLTADAVRTFVLHLVADSLLACGLKPELVPDDYDLLSGGVMDSFGLIEMITSVEDEFGLELDFEQMEPEQVGIIGDFARFVVETGARTRA